MQILSDHKDTLKKLFSIIAEFSREPKVIKELTWLLINLISFPDTDASAVYDQECDIVQSTALCI